VIKKSIILSYVFSILIIIFISACTNGGKPEIVVRDAVMVRSGMMKGVASSFMRIINNGSGSDRLTGCAMKEYPSARGELHDFKDGRMTKVEGVKIPAHEITELSKGNLHIMFFKLPEKLKETVTLIMNFSKSGPIEVKVSTDTRK